MTVIPNFILKRLYCKGSLRKLEGGLGFDIVNNLGPGMISKLNYIKLNEHTFPPEQVALEIDGKLLPADQITEDNPAAFFLNQVITCRLASADLPPGKYQIHLDIISKEAGKVSLTVEDELPA